MARPCGQRNGGKSDGSRSVEDNHGQLAIPAIDHGAGGQGKNKEGQALQGADESCLKGGMGQSQHQQGKSDS